MAILPLFWCTPRFCPWAPPFHYLPTPSLSINTVSSSTETWPNSSSPSHLTVRLPSGYQILIVHQRILLISIKFTLLKHYLSVLFDNGSVFPSLVLGSLDSSINLNCCPNRDQNPSTSHAAAALVALIKHHIQPAPLTTMGSGVLLLVQKAGSILQPFMFVLTAGII